jgi:putative N6-adenine-specific DNA methylase
VEKVATMPWKYYLRPGQPVAVRATCRRSKIYHTDAVAERVAEGIGERLGVPTPLKRFQEESDAKDAPRLIVARIVNDRCTISVDTSGASLHRRGYRQATAKAPLRETLAAAILLASGWDGASPLLDPFCGSGTIAIEAALLALGIAPGVSRRFAFMDWPNFDKPLWQKILREAGAARRDPRPPGESPAPIVLASDRDAGAIQSARENAARAGVAEHIQFLECAVSAVEPPPGPGWIVTNPPYGVRIAGKSDLRNLYAKFGAVARAKCPGWGVAMLSSHPQLAHATGLAFDEGIPLRNGGLRIRLVRARVDSTGATPPSRNPEGNV